MSRYENTKNSYDKNRSHYKHNTTIYSDVPEQNGDLYVITQTGDRLDNLAHQYYGDPKLWWFIANTNGLTAMNVEPGIRLRISFDLEKATDILDKSI